MMKLHWPLALFLFWFACCGQAAEAPAQATRGMAAAVQKTDTTRRVALVIGNGKYRAQPLDNPARDARAIAQELTGAGFETQLLVDGDRMAIIRALEEFRQRLRGAGVGLFYFAGHGVQMEGSNFLIPVDADLGSEDQVKYNTLKLDDVLATLDQAGTPVKIVVLDACRNNPFERGRGGSGGLAPVNNPVKGTLIAYATSPGRVALDGEPGKNGLYTTHLLEAIRQPGLGIEQVFKYTRARVAEASKGRQIPWESTSLTGELQLRPGPTPPPASSLVAAAAVAGESASRGLARPHAVGEKFRDCPRCPEMVVVPPGQFTMGAPLGEAGRQASEGPALPVTVARSFAVGRFEVTFQEWEACLIDGDCNHWPQDQGWGRGARPVMNVSWEDARRYLAWLTKRTGRAYRLLSEAEWEYVARAGSAAARPWGADLGQGHAQCRDCGPSPVGTRPVGAFAGNPWGLHDVLGNVWEWVEDCEVATLQGRPPDAVAVASGDCSRRAVRGGGWSTAAKGLRLGTRSFFPVSRRDATVGFRVAASLPAP